MPNRPIEDILRQRLRQHPTPLDTDALWDKVEPRLPQKRRIIPLWIWILTGAVLFGGLYLFLPQQQEEPKAVANFPTVVANTTPPTSPAPAAAPKTPLNPEQPEVSGAVPEQRAAGRTPKPGVATPAPTSATSVEMPFIPAPPLLAGLLPAEATPPPVRKRAQTAVPFLPVRQDYADVVSRYQHITFTFTEKAIPAVSTPEPQVAAAKTSLPEPLVKADDRKAEPPALPEAEEAARHERPAEKEGQRIAPLEAKLAKANEQSREKKPKNIREKQAAYWTVEPGIALSLPGRSVSAAGDSPNEGQAGINDEHEKGLEGITLQGLVGYHRANGLSIRTGFVYSRINSKVASEFTTVGTEPVQAVVAIIESPNGSRHEQTGTVQVATETTATERHYNSVTALDIPLLIGYRFGGSKWGLTVEAGPTFNLSSGGSTHLYDGAGNYRLVASGHFRSKLTGRGFLANFGGAYNLSEKTMLTANLRVQGFSQGGFEDPAAGYATKYTLLGVQLGYRVRF